jgi:hypothetical protein
MSAERGPSRGATMTASRPAVSMSRGSSSREGRLSRFAISAKIDAPRRSTGVSFSSRNLAEFRPATPKATDRKANGFNLNNTRPIDVGLWTKPFEKAAKQAEKQPFRLIKRSNTFSNERTANTNTNVKKLTFGEKTYYTQPKTLEASQRMRLPRHSFLAPRNDNSIKGYKEAARNNPWNNIPAQKLDVSRTKFDAKFAHVLRSKNPLDKIKIATENKKTWITSKPIDYKKDFSKIQKIERIEKLKKFRSASFETSQKNQISSKLAEIKPRHGYYRRAELKAHQFSTQKNILPTRSRMSKPERSVLGQEMLPKHKVEILPKVNEQPQIRKFKATEVQKLSLVPAAREVFITPSLSFRVLRQAQDKLESRNLIPQKQLSGLRSRDEAIAPFEMTASTSNVAEANVAAHTNRSDLASARRVFEAYTKLGLTKNEAQTKVLQVLQIKQQEHITPTLEKIKIQPKNETDKEQKTQTKTKEQEIFLAQKKEEEQRPIICFIESLQKLQNIKTTEEQKRSKGILGRYIDLKNPQKKSEKIVLGTATPIGTQASNSESNHNAEICADCQKIAQKKHFALSV